MNNTENINNQSEQKLKTNQLLILLYIVLNFFKQIYISLHMDRLLKHQKDSTELSYYEKNIKYRLISTGPGIRHVSEFPTLETLEGWAERGNTKEIQRLFFKIQDEYNQRAQKLKNTIKNDLQDYQQYLKKSMEATRLRVVLPVREKYLKEKQEELVKAKKDQDLELAKKTKNKAAIDFGNKDIKRLEGTISDLQSEIATIKKDYADIQNDNAQRVKELLDKNIIAQKQWNNLLCVLFNWVYLEDQWRIACERKAPGEFSKIFKEHTFQLTEDTYLFLCLSGGYYSESTVGILRKNYGKLQDLPDYTEESQRTALTIFDESDKYRKGAMGSITKPNQLMHYSNLLDCLSYMQTALTKFNENAKNNYKDFNETNNKSAFLIWLRGMIGLAPNYSPNETLPNCELTDFVIPSKINRVEDPYQNPDISPVQYNFDYEQSQYLGKKIKSDEESMLRSIAEVARNSPLLQNSFMNLSHNPNDKEVNEIFAQTTSF